MKIAISITTYNRPTGLKNLLVFLSMQNLPELDLNVLIIDDCSALDYSDCFNEIKKSDMKIEFRMKEQNHGKKQHWKIMNEIFQWYRKQDFDYALHIQDDIEIDPGFLSRMIQTFQDIPHPEKVCINFLYDADRVKRTNWTPKKAEPIVVNGRKLYKTGWIDLNFFANRNFFRFLKWKIRPVNPSRWERIPQLSSGVGKQISKRLFVRGAGMFMVTSAQAGHGSYESVMNP